MICDVHDGAWVRYDGLDFGAGGITAVALWLACADGRDGGTVRLRLDRSDGPIIAETRVVSTGSYSRFVTKLVPVAPVSGRHDVYVTFAGKNGVADLMELRFFRGPLPGVGAELATAPAARQAPLPKRSPTGARPPEQPKSATDRMLVEPQSVTSPRRPAREGDAPR